jgi:hypothetical protein
MAWQRELWAEVDVLLTDEDAEWIIATLQNALAESRSKSPDLT